jgi:RHS repeat-associated protein
MKQITLTITLLYTLVLPLYGQPTDGRNYIQFRTFKQAGADVNDVSKVVTQIQYIDGLGRPVQNVTIAQSPAGLDIVQPMAYDGAGRQPRQYLPYIAEGEGSYKGSAITDVAGWYLANSAQLQTASPTTLDLQRPFSETIFESSPLSRTATQQGPGTRSRSGAVKYKVNTAAEVKRYDYDAGANTINYIGDYAVGDLTRKAYKDEQDFETNEYTDLLGQVVCKSVLTGSETLYTYYVFDDLVLLRAVLQPNYQVDGSLTNSVFLYDYDDQARMVKKQIPGSGTVELVYDQYDRPVYSRDAAQLARGVWGFTKYDELNRPVVTGEISSAATRATQSGSVDAGATHHENRDNAAVVGYSLSLTAPITATEANLLTITFYDDYSFSKPAGFRYSSSAGYPAAENTTVKSQVTGGRTRILPGNGATGDWITNVTYYDAEYRTIQTVRELYDLGNGANERISTQYKYDLAAVVSEQKTVQIVGGITHSHVALNSYDHADRLLSVKETVTAGAKTKTAYTLAQRYNTLGQLQSKWFHGYTADPSRYRRRTNYTNNIRGWLTDAKTWYQQTQGTDLPFYAFSLSYNNVLYAPQYSNGNISKMEWLGKDETAFSAGLSFTYDKANRLLAAVKPVTATYTYADTESGITYDRNGNIKTLVRAGAVVDNLSYSYAGNRLTAVSDASASNTGVKSGASSYSYDNNGNITSDGNRSATLSYNYLNLPKTVTTGGKTLTYDYDASGNKHKYVADTLTRKYAGRFEYDQNNSLKRVATSEGQLVPSGDTLRFDYFLKDHLGNVRVVFNEKGDIIQKNDYYPFGLEIDRNSPVQAQNARNGVNRYLYNGNEKQPETGFLDYGARQYDPSIARWMVVDRFSEKFINTSPYQYALNNPISNIDINGDTTYRFDGTSGTYLGMFDLDATGQVGSYGTTTTVGKGKNKQQQWDGQYFNFADPVGDSKDIMNGTIASITFVSEEDIQAMMSEQGAFETGKANFGWESQGGGDFDYSNTIMIKKYPGADYNGTSSNTLFLPKGESTAHNFMNFGNYLWGATGYTVGFGYGELQVGAHANSLLNPGRNGYPSQLDSKDDQRSIKNGIYHSQSNGYRQLRK